jgi:hypothetical protein
MSKAGIAEATAKAELYRYINEPEEAESICRDILSLVPDHQLALRMLGLAITDQFLGAAADRYPEVLSLFQSLRDPYERFYRYILRAEDGQIFRARPDQPRGRSLSRRTSVG